MAALNNSIRDRVISLLGAGYSQATVASACGVTPSWVSQLVDEDAVREQVSQLRTNKLEESVKVDDTINDLEQKALKVIGDKLPFVRNPMDAARIFATLNGAKRRTLQGTPEGDNMSADTVTITLPRAAASIHIQLNQNNQVVEVEGRSMATLPSRALPSLAASSRGTQITDVPSVQDIRDQTKLRLQRADADRAEGVLRNLEVMIDGVPCVI